MAISQYREVIRQPGATGILILGFLARIPFSTMGILLTLHIVTTLHRSYLDAGLVVAVSTIGSAISSPWRGRLVDTYGLRRAVVPTIIVEAIVWLLLPYSDYALLLPLSFIGGIFSLPIWSVIRVSLAVVVPAALRRTAYALDSVLTEFVFMIGPAAITVIALAIGTRPAMMIVGLSIAVVGIALLIVNPPTQSSKIVIPAKLDPSFDAMESAVLARNDDLTEKTAYEQITKPEENTEDERRLARKLLSRPAGISILVATVTGHFILVGSEVAVTALLISLDEKQYIGAVMALWCLGSAIGGFAIGASKRVIEPLWVLFALGALTIPLAFAWGAFSAALLAFVAGFGCAPIITATGDAIARLVPERARGEAMGWHGSAITVGAGLGAPVVGLIIDASSPAWGFIIAGLAGVLVAVFGTIATRVHRTRVRRRLAASAALQNLA
ncbi:MFS transporter [Dermabacteraceae bacterium TAE3-ERU27]|nr:MFS transporter [Dermabacteraceae bacterium TAE3-ERU27]